MGEKQVRTKLDWRIGITWDVLIMGIYALGSAFEIVSDPGSTNIVSFLLLAGLSYYTYSAYNIQRNKLDGQNVKSAMILGFVILAAFLFFALANLLFMMSGELTQDMSYLNLLLFSALFKSVFTLRKLSKGDKQPEKA